jgi:pseudouridine-5'-phosphate glycosidase
LGVRGKDVTPFLLQRVNEKSQGESLRANVALVKHNARVGAQIALEYHNNNYNNRHHQGGDGGQTVRPLS